MTTEIPRGTYNSDGPCWVPRVAQTGQVLRPAIKCICGKICFIDLHHVHADGTVTASFFDSTAKSFVHNGREYQHTPGCGWHVWLKLLNYDQGEFLPSE